MTSQPHTCVNMYNIRTLTIITEKKLTCLHFCTLTVETQMTPLGQL